MNEPHDEFALLVYGEVVPFATYAEMLRAAIHDYPPTAKLMRRQVTDWQWTA